jgi:hypothetical protein
VSGSKDTSGNEPVARNWARWFLEKLYAGLTRADPVQPVDLIFVMAGRMNRKQYGFELYRQGVAPKLVLSVGRFEVSKMLQTEFAFVNELVALRSVTPTNQRHFFVSLDQSRTRVELAPVRQWNTYGEVVGLMHYLEHEHAAKIMVVSTMGELAPVGRQSTAHRAAPNSIPNLLCPCCSAKSLRR